MPRRRGTVLPAHRQMIARWRRGEKLSLQTIADTLTAHHIPTPGGRSQWYPAQVREVLRGRYGSLDGSDT